MPDAYLPQVCSKRLLRPMSQARYDMLQVTWLDPQEAAFIYDCLNVEPTAFDKEPERFVRAAEHIRDIYNRYGIDYAMAFMGSACFLRDMQAREYSTLDLIDNLEDLTIIEKAMDEFVERYGAATTVRGAVLHDALKQIRVDLPNYRLRDLEEFFDAHKDVKERFESALSRSIGNAYASVLQSIPAITSDYNIQ